MKNLIKIFTVALFLFVTYTASAQQGFGTNSPAASAVVEMMASDKGVLLPRVALTSTNSSTPITNPANAITVFNTATAGTAPYNVTPGYYYWNSSDSKWIRLVDSKTIGESTTNTLSATNGQLVSTVNGVSNSSEVNVLTTTVNGITSANGTVALGGALTRATTIVTGVSNTFAIKGLQASGSADKVLAIDPVTGVLKVTENPDFTKTVYINGTSPATATLFDEANPPATNNDSLKADVNNIYIGTDGIAWSYNTATSSYVTYNAPASTPFYTALTTTDAGGNKTTNIWRSGKIGIGTNSPQTLLDVSSSSGNSNITVGTPGTSTTEEVSINLATKYDRTNAFASSANRGWQIGARGNAFSGSNNTFHASFWNGTTYLPYFNMLSNGNVGIKGVTNPQQALDVAGSAMFRSTENAIPQIYLGFSNTHHIRSRHDGNTTTGNPNNAIDFYVWRASDGAVKPTLTLQGTGNVGIGTIAPAAVLDVNTPLAATATVNADANMFKLSRPMVDNAKYGNVAQFNLGSYDIFGADARTRLDLGLNNDGNLTPSPVMTWQGNGFVGIGTTLPVTTLDVNGTGSFRNGGEITDFTVNNQILFAFKTGTPNRFRHAIKTRHNSLATAGNAIDFYVWKHGTDAIDAVGTQQVMTLDGNGNVGIGTTVPSSKLDIQELNTTAFQSTINVSSNPAALATAGFNGTNPDITKASSGIQFLGWSGRKEGGIFRQTGSSSKSHLMFTVNNTNDVAMTINEGRNVGIGTTAPQTTLHVQNLTPVTNTVNADAKVLRLARPGVSGVRWDNIAQFNLGSYATVAGGGNVEARSRLDLALTDGNTNITTLNVMTWQANGRVGIGTTAPAYALDVVGDINASGSVRAAGTALTSDARLKHNINNIGNGLNKIMQLRPVNYDKKMSLDSAATTINENGFIAQELQKIMPELVSEGKDKDKLLSVNYTAIIPVLTKAIQEQQALIEKSQATIDKQQAQINELKALVEKMINKQ